VQTSDVAACVVAAAWLYLLAGRGRFWTTAIRLPAPPELPAPAKDAWPAVAVVVPARNEEEVLATTLPSLLGQDYPGPARVVVVDDGSTDGTAAVALAAAASVTTGAGLALDVVPGQPRPTGWMGKPWALRQGVAHATSAPVPALTAQDPPASPQWLLFTDADIQHPPDSLRRLMATALAGGRDEVSLMARLRAQGGWERLLIPAFVYFFAQLYPFRWVGRPGRTAAAAGGCVLVRRGALDAAGSVESIRDAVIDDVALARRLKRSGSSIWLGLADEVQSVRPYRHLADLWQMVARSAFTQLRRSPWLVAGTVVGLAALYLGPLLALVTGALSADGWLLGAGALGVVIMVTTYLPMVRYYGLGWPWALTLPVAAVMYGAMTIDSARRQRHGQGVEWKGRQAGRVPAPPLE
jgi:hopene-associated glycosyltransferase HpnB